MKLEERSLIAAGVESMSIRELELIVERYPWFTLGRKELFCKVYAKSGELNSESLLKRTAAYLFCRSDLYNIVNRIDSSKNQDCLPILDVESNDRSVESELFIGEIVPDDELFILEDDFPVLDKDETPQKSYHILGGDYFTKKDFEELSKDGKSVTERLSINFNEGGENVSEEVVFEDLTFNNESFYTETLAKIYAEQSLYKNATDIYKKLILLYPEKSGYFASLIDELKIKNN